MSLEREQTASLNWCGEPLIRCIVREENERMFSTQASNRPPQLRRGGARLLRHFLRSRPHDFVGNGRIQLLYGIRPAIRN